LDFGNEAPFAKIDIALTAATIKARAYDWELALKAQNALMDHAQRFYMQHQHQTATVGQRQHNRTFYLSRHRHLLNQAISTENSLKNDIVVRQK